MESALAPSTIAFYNRCLKNYREFVALHSLPYILPISVNNLSCYITHLYNEGLPASTISFTISALSYFHKLNGIQDPTKVFRIKQLLLSIRKIRQTSDKREPITERILFKIIDNIPKLGLSHFETCLTKAMFLIAFYFGLRVGELTTSQHNFSMDNLKLTHEKLTISFTSYKHSPEDPTNHSIMANNSNHCPVKAIAEYLIIRGSDPGPLFKLKGKPISRTFFTARLKQLLILAGESSSNFTSHSFRIGAATYWAGKGFYILGRKGFL